METAGGILTARSCVLASLECSQNSVFKRKQNKEDKEKKTPGDEHGALARDDGKPK